MFRKDNLDIGEGRRLENTIPKDPFADELIVIYNPFKRFGDEYDRLMKIISRRYGPTKPGQTEKRWNYTGELFKMRPTNSKGLPIIPYEQAIIYDVPEDNLITRKELLSF